VIHPRQVDIVNASFVPSQKAIEFARRVIEGAREEEELRGVGAFVLDGKMIDEPVVKQARNVLLRAGVTVPR
jgi:citrate lyase beta subunit